MTAQVLFFNVFSEKDPHLNAVEGPSVNIKNKMSKHLKTVSISSWDFDNSYYFKHLFLTATKKLFLFGSNFKIAK